MGGKLGTIFTRAGHEVVFSYARSEGIVAAGADDKSGGIGRQPWQMPLMAAAKTFCRRSKDSPANLMARD